MCFSGQAVAHGKMRRQTHDDRAGIHSVFATIANRGALVVVVAYPGVCGHKRDLESGSLRNAGAFLARINHHECACSLGNVRACRGAYGVGALGDTTIVNVLMRGLICAAWPTEFGPEFGLHFGLALAMAAIQAQTSEE